MKKKGLIISTIVMVVVLIASLTTATYAWFNTAASVSVDRLDVSVASTSNIAIGLAKNIRTSGEGAVGELRDKATSYMYSVGSANFTYEETSTEADKGKGLGTFTGSRAGLGTLVKWNWVLSSMGGVYSSANGTSFDEGYTATTRQNALYNGHLDTDGSTVVIGTKALYNGNTKTGETANTVVFAPFGLRVEKEGMKYLYCDITITPKSEEFWGIIASLLLEIKTGDVDYFGHPFAATTADGLCATAITSESTPTTTGEENNKTINPVVFRFVIAYDANHIKYNGETGAQIYTFDIRMFLDGKDASCIQSATAYGATIDLKFDAVAALPVDSAIVKNLYTSA